MKLFIIKIIQFSYSLLIATVIIILINYIVDPFGVLKGDMNAQNIEPNQHYLKVDFIINNPTKFDSFLFGSSRVGKIDTKKIKGGNKWYNMSYSEGVPLEHLNNIKIFIQNKVEIKNIIIGLDNISYLVDPEIHKSETMRKPYVNFYNPYFSYFIIKPKYEIIKRALFPKKNKDSFSTEYNIYNSGVPIIRNVDNFINSHQKQHNLDKKFSEPSWKILKYKNRTDAVINKISEIINICNEENIELKFFINPIHITTYRKLDLHTHLNFLSKLSQITEFYDFSGINKITTNNFNYYETSHYRPFIGEKIIDIIFDEKNIEFPNFGQKVNKFNIDSIRNLREFNINKYNTHLDSKGLPKVEEVIG